MVAGYNEDDCRATLALRDWLEERRRSWPPGWAGNCPARCRPRSRRTAGDPELARIRTALLDGVPADPAERTGPSRRSALLADLLDWHRREASRAGGGTSTCARSSDDELIGEPDALGGL